jgi:Flp pilus assembly protein TadG
MKASKRHRGSRGVATILVVGIVAVFLIFFLVVGIDFAYIYVVRGQMQNAADAAALAGAALIADPQDVVQFDARDEAIEFAGKNTAAGETVVVVTNNSNSLSDGNDITVGFWDGSTYTRGGEPVNAIEVKTRRTEESPGGPVGLFFGKLVGWPVMEVSRIAIAANPARAEAPIALCLDACTSGVVNAAGTKFIWGPTVLEKDNPFAIAFTDFEPDKNVNVPDTVQFFCGKVFEACNVPIGTTQSAPAVVDRQFRCAFLNPLYDSAHKTCADGACNSATDTVISWSPLVPIIEQCPPGLQGAKFEPYDIIAFARAKIINVHIKAEGGVGSGSPNNCACQALLANQGYTSSPVSETALIINAIDCVFCDDPDIDELLGKRSFLVR